MFPFHTWLPLAHVEAPTAGSILLAGVLLKVGSYGMLRFNMGMTPLGRGWLFPLLATLAVIGIIYGALAALAQTDIKRLVAYSSVSHMGFIVLGMFAMNATGMDGAVIQMVNHGLTTGRLFACVGVIYERYHTREMAELGGLWKRLPLLRLLPDPLVDGIGGGSGAERVRRRVPDPRRDVLAKSPSPAMHRVDRDDPRRVLSALDASAGRVRSAPRTALATATATTPRYRPVGWHEIAGLTPLMVLIVLDGGLPGSHFQLVPGRRSPRSWRRFTRWIDEDIDAAAGRS